MSGIRVENLYKQFGSFVAVDNAHFNVNRGELAVLLGPSGSGKSTILRIIAGLDIPDSGTVFLEGEDVTRRTARERRIGFVFQHYALFRHMTVAQNIAFGMKVRKRKKEEINSKVSELLDLVKLEGYENHYPEQLSGGQRQRVALARALAPQPAILLLDEPFGALDAKVRENLADWLRNLHSTISLTTILVTHDQQEAIDIADKIIVINRGKVEQTGSAREVYEHPKTKFTASFVGRTNVITGIVKDGSLYLGELELIPRSGDVLPGSGETAVLLARPEDIRLSIPRETDSSQLIGTLEHVHYRGNYFEVDVTAGGYHLIAYLSKQDESQLELKKGRHVAVSFHNYRFFDAPEGEAAIRRKLAQLGYIE